MAPLFSPAIAVIALRRRSSSTVLHSIVGSQLRTSASAQAWSFIRVPRLSETLSPADSYAMAKTEPRSLRRFPKKRGESNYGFQQQINCRRSQRTSRAYLLLLLYTAGRAHLFDAS